MRSNMVRIKPTSGLVARDNVIVTLLRGTIGPIARTVRDAAIMLSFMARLSQEDSGTDKIPFTTILDYESRARLMAYAIAGLEFCETL
jgi:amidase